jgi:hypothetical protein
MSVLVCFVSGDGGSSRFPYSTWIHISATRHPVILYQGGSSFLPRIERSYVKIRNQLTSINRTPLDYTQLPTTNKLFSSRRTPHPFIK